MRDIRRVGGVAALLLSTVLAATSACGSSTEGPDASAVPTATSPAPTSNDAPASTDVPDESTTTVLADEPTSTGVEVEPPYGGAPEGPDFVRAQWLVPWDDGFLAMGVHYPPAGLPEELPPEIAELFPPEVVELFPDGLPPTQQEAIEILEDAGLFDVLMDVINEHPEAFDALTAVPQPDPTMVATWSRDGEGWTSLDVTPPAGFGIPTQAVVFDDRLTIVGSAPPSEVTPFPRQVSIATTTDLDTWVMDSFEIELPSTVPESVQVSTDPVAVAANDDGWVVRVMTNAFVDPFQFLPESVGELLGEADMGLGTDSDGVTVEHIEDGTVTVVERFTWDELGIAEELLPYVRGSSTTMALWGGPWGGQPQSPIINDGPFGTLMATTAGFLDLAEDAAFSPDGITWTAVETPQPNLMVEAAAPLGDDVMAFTRNAADEVAVYRLDPTGEIWTLLDVPAGVDDAHSWSQSSSAAFLLETRTDDPGPQRIVAQHEGFELTMTYGAVQSYRLVDESTGDVVLEESIDLTVTPAPPDGPFQNLVEDMNGITITDPETGDVILSIPHSVIGAAWDATRSDEADEAPWPDWWVLATDDGEAWLYADYDEGDGAEPAMPFLVATNDDDVLVGSQAWEPANGAWHRFPMPG